MSANEFDIETFNMESSEIDKARGHKLSFFSYLCSMIILLTSIFDMCFLPYKIIHWAIDGKLNNIDLIIWAFIFVIYLYVNNLRLKAGAFLWGHSQSDTKITESMGNVLESIGSKISNKNGKD